MYKARLQHLNQNKTALIDVSAAHIPHDTLTMKTANAYITLYNTCLLFLFLLNNNESLYSNLSIAFMATFNHTFCFENVTAIKSYCQIYSSNAEHD